MAERYLSIPNKSPVWYYPTEVGITGLTACKCGHTVQLFFDCTVSASTGGWVNIGTLPEALRPYATTRFPIYDNDVTSSAANTCVDVSVMGDGRVNIYLFNDKLQTQALGSITYISNRG